MGLGLGEPKQLQSLFDGNLVANNIDPSRAYSKLLDDMETQYDDKIGFEDTLNNLKTERQNRMDKDNKNRGYLSMQNIINPIVYDFFSNGISSQNKIDLN